MSGLETVLELARNQKKIKGNGTSDANEIADPENPSWIAEGIVVKIKDKELEKYYNKKAKILKVVSDYVAEVETLDSKAKMEIDQEFLETIIPVKKEYLILNLESRRSC